MRNRSTVPVIAFATVFTSCIVFAYCWFNTDIGRSDPRPSILDSRPLIWLTAQTNIPGYTFIPEPVSDEVKKVLGTTNILNGTFVRDTERRKSNDERRTAPHGKSKVERRASNGARNDPRPSTLDPRPSTLDPRPSTLDPRPSTLDPRPSTFDPRPSTLDLRPSTLPFPLPHHRLPRHLDENRQARLGGNPAHPLHLLGGKRLETH